MSESVETEAKLSVPHALTFERLRRLQTVPGYTISRPVESRVVDTFKDTEALALLREGLALRERRHDAGYTITVKAFGSTEGAVHQREEIEEERAGPLGNRLDSGGPIAERVGELVNDGVLHDVFAYSQVRVVRTLTRGGSTRMSVSLDEVTMSRGGETRVFREVEIEAAGGTGADEVARLGRWMSDAYGLPAEGRTKFEQGLTFFGVFDRPAVPARRGSRGPARKTLVSEMDLTEALRLLLAEQLYVVTANEAAILRSPTVGAVHDMRVAAQRSRALLTLFPRQAVRSERDAMEAFLKRVRDRLGAVRDLHVFPKTLRDAASSIPDFSARAAAAAAAAAPEAEKALIRYLSSKEYRRGREAFLSRPPSARRLDHRKEPIQLRDALPTLLLRRLGIADSFHRQMDPSSYTDLHELRKLVKSLRYCLEFFEPVLGPACRRMRKTAVRVQDALGSVQDTVTAGEICRSLGVSSPALGERLEAYALTCREGAADRWIDLCDPGLRRTALDEILQV